MSLKSKKNKKAILPFPHDLIYIPDVKYILSRFFPMKGEVTTEPKFFIKKNYRHRVKPKYLDLESRRSKITYQPDVYNVIADLARNFGCSHILDVGCGTARKLVSLFPQFEIIGIDYGKNVLNCRKQYKFGTWIESDLENPESIKISEDILTKTAIVCSDVIEHLVNPTYLLENLKTLLDSSPITVLTTPERDLTHGKKHFGPSPNPHHIREWNLEELEKLLRYHKFNLAFLGLTASNDKKYEQKTIIVGIKNNKLENNSEKWKDLKREHTTILKQFF